MSDKNLEGGVAVVTGAGRGLGRAFSIGLAAAGMRVAAVARSSDQTAETVRLIEQAGGTAVALRADVTDAAAVRRMAEEARERLGPISLLINNAGSGGPFGPAWEADPGDWWRCFETNMRGPFLYCREIIPECAVSVSVAPSRGNLGNPRSPCPFRPKAINLVVEMNRR